MRINGRILIAVVGFVIVAAAGALGLGKLGGFELTKDFDPPNTAQQATGSVTEDVQGATQATPADAAKDEQATAHQATAAEVAKDVQAMKQQTTLPKALDNYTELVDIRADGQAVVFVHRLTFEAKQSKAYEFLAAVRTNMLRPVCSQRKMAKAMNEGVVFRYQYDDVVGFNVGSFDIGGNDCTG
jgi:hypothetical protein